MLPVYVDIFNSTLLLDVYGHQLHHDRREISYIVRPTLTSGGVWSSRYGDSLTLAVF